MKRMLSALGAFWHDEEGASLVEYALLVFLIALAVIVIITYLGNRLNAIFSSICMKLNNNTACTGT